MVQYTASHSLSELIGLCSLGEGPQEQEQQSQQQRQQANPNRWKKKKKNAGGNVGPANNNDVYNSNNVHVTCIGKHKILVDVRSGYYMNTQMTTSGKTCMAWSMNSNGGIVTPYDIDRGLLQKQQVLQRPPQFSGMYTTSPLFGGGKKGCGSSNIADGPDGSDEKQLAMWEYCQNRAIAKAAALPSSPRRSQDFTTPEEKEQEEVVVVVEGNGNDHRLQSGFDSTPQCGQEVGLARSEIETKFHYLQLAIHYCEESTKIVASHGCHQQRRALIETAISTCPDLCAQAYYMKYELLSESLLLPSKDVGGAQGGYGYRGNCYGDDDDCYYHWKEYSLLNAKEHQILEKSLSCLESAVHAGKAFVDLIHANDDCPGDDDTPMIMKGQLYTFLPTRWLVRSLYTLGSLEYYCGRYDHANLYLKECLAMDVHDKLGARHKQLMVALERAAYKANIGNANPKKHIHYPHRPEQQCKMNSPKSKQGSRTNGEIEKEEDVGQLQQDDATIAGFLGSSELKNLLKARFGEDQNRDSVLALWNYTRALHAYVRDGCGAGEHSGSKNNSTDRMGVEPTTKDCGGSPAFQKLLSYAMEKNPFVPPLLLSMEIAKEPYTFMKIGDESEAADYCHDNRVYWENTKGALAAMETMYRHRFLNTATSKRMANLKNKRSSPLSLRKVAATTCNRNDSECDVKEATALLTEGISLLYERQPQNLPQAPSHRRRYQAAISKFQQVFRKLDPNAASNQQLLRKSFQGQAVAHAGLLEFEAAFQYYSNALSVVDLTDASTMQGLYCDRAACRERLGDLRGSLEEYKFVYARSGCANAKAMEGMFRIENRLGIDASSIPVPPVPKIDHNVCRHASCDTPSVATTMERCSNCERGGVKLMLCSGCGQEALKFCSKDCQMALWKKSHKYYCKASKNRLEVGMTVVIQGLQNATQHNGKQGKVICMLEDKGRFGIEIIPNSGAEDNQEEEKEEKNHVDIDVGDHTKSSAHIQLSVRPENLRKQE